MKKDEDVLVFCHPYDAVELQRENEYVFGFAVVSAVIPIGEVTVVPKAEFLEWLKGKKE